MDIFALSRRVRNSVASRYRTYSWKTYEGLKPKLNRVRYTAPPPATVFIFGCQRSGTTHLERLFRADLRSVVYGEYSALSVTPDRTVWMPAGSMRDRLARDAARYTVVRSLLASHQARDVLGDWPGASAFWVFRDANSVVDSMVRKWNGDFFDISKRVETTPDGRWDLAELWQRIHQEAQTLAPDAGPRTRIRDAYALFWLYRNQLAFDLDLPSLPQVVMADYADVTARPEAYLDHGLALAGVEPVTRRYRLETRRASPGKAGNKPRVSPPIQARCDALYDALRTAAEPTRQKIGTA